MAGLDSPERLVSAQYLNNVEFARMYRGLVLNFCVSDADEIVVSIASHPLLLQNVSKVNLELAQNVMG